VSAQRLSERRERATSVLMDVSQRLLCIQKDHRQILCLQYLDACNPEKTLCPLNNSVDIIATPPVPTILWHSGIVVQPAITSPRTQ
jgi:hypothetical protein